MPPQLPPSPKKTDADRVKEDKDLIDRIYATLRSLTSLRIVTVVGQVTITAPDDPNAKPLTDSAVKFTGSDHKAVVTEIDLVDGDIITIIDPVFKDNPDDPILLRHAKMIAEGREVVKQNVELVERLGGKIAQMFDQKKKAQQG